MPLRDEVLLRVGDAADLTAFELPLHASRFHYPTLADWRRLNPSMPTATTRTVEMTAAREFSRPTLPLEWDRYIGEREHPWAKLLRNAPLAALGERRGNSSIATRQAAVRSYLGGVGAYTANVNRQSREQAKAERVTGGIEWRWELTGKIERTSTSNRRETIAEGTQIGPWQRLGPGEIASDRELRAAYYDAARAAIRTQTGKTTSDGRHGPGDAVSSLYTGDSDEAILTLSAYRIVTRPIPPIEPIPTIIPPRRRTPRRRAR